MAVNESAVLKYRVPSIAIMKSKEREREMIYGKESSKFLGES